MSRCIAISLDALRSPLTLFPLLSMMTMSSGFTKPLLQMVGVHMMLPSGNRTLTAFYIKRLLRNPYEKYTNIPTTSHNPNRIQVIHGRPSIKYRQEITPRIGMKGTQGVLNDLGRFGSRLRRTRIPMHTRMKANSVPMFVRSTISSILVNIAHTPTATPVRMVVTCGVRNLGCTLAKDGGNSPSRAIEKKILGWPS